MVVFCGNSVALLFAPVGVSKGLVGPRSLRSRGPINIFIVYIVVLQVLEGGEEFNQAQSLSHDMCKMSRQVSKVGPIQFPGLKIIHPSQDYAVVTLLVLKSRDKK